MMEVFSTMTIQDHLAVTSLLLSDSVKLLMDKNIGSVETPGVLTGVRKTGSVLSKARTISVLNPHAAGRLLRRTRRRMITPSLSTHGHRWKRRRPSRPPRRSSRVLACQRARACAVTLRTSGMWKCQNASRRLSLTRTSMSPTSQMTGTGAM